MPQKVNPEKSDLSVSITAKVRKRFAEACLEDGVSLSEATKAAVKQWLAARARRKQREKASNASGGNGAKGISGGEPKMNGASEEAPGQLNPADSADKRHGG